MVEPVSTTIGVASFAFQVFQAVQTGYGYFESAVNMPQDCASLKLRLRIEYAKLLDWADEAGLSDKSRHEEFNRKLKVNRPIIMALLGEIRAILENLHEIGLRHEEAKWDTTDTAAGSAERGIERQDSGEHSSNQGSSPKIDISIPQQEGVAAEKPEPRANFTEDISKVDLDKFATIFKSPAIPKEKRRGMRGFRHIIELTKGAKSIAKNPMSLQWAISSKSKFEENLKRLKDLTDYLQQTLGDHQMQILLEMTRETWMAMLQLSTSIHDVKELLTVSRTMEPVQIDADDSASFISQGTTLRDDASLYSITDVDIMDKEQHIKKTIFEKLTQFSITYKNVTKGETSKKPKKLDEDPAEFNAKFVLSQEGSDNSRSFATFNGIAVWIEWKKFKTAQVQSLPGHIRDINFPLAGAQLASPQDITHAEQLVTLLQAKDKPEEFRIPPCLGYFQDEKRSCFGFMYATGEKQRSSGPTSLLELLGEGTPRSISQRISIAKEIALCLLYLHSVDWLHKGLRSASILFFPKKNSSAVGNAYISSFEYARPDERDLTTSGTPDTPDWAVYSHPKYQNLNPDLRPKFRRSYDIYSLGIILVEIAYWKAADTILGLDKVLKTERESRVAKASTVTESGDLSVPFWKNMSLSNSAATSSFSMEPLKKIKQRLLKDEPELLENVRIIMGERYHNATRACLEGLQAFQLPLDADETDPGIKALLQQAYMRLVVDTLNSIAV